MADEEQVFLDQGGVLVTNKRIVTGGGTYAMAGVVSVRAESDLADKTGPIAMMVVGGLLGAAFAAAGAAERPVSIGGIAFGVMVAGAMILIALLWKLGQKSRFTMVLRNAGGEVKAVESDDQVFVGMVVEAVNKAMVSRA